jgi:hypothetical protein
MAREGFVNDADRPATGLLRRYLGALAGRM